MSTYHGKDAKVMLGSVDLSAFLNSVDLSIDVDTADTTTFGSSWKSSLPGVAGAKCDFGGLYDPAVLTLPTLIASLTPGVLTVCPAGGAAIGDRARLLSAADTAYSESSPVGGVVAVAGSFLATGVVGLGDVLHPLGVDTNTTTGASKNDTAATATGWTAHLHVTAVSSGTWTVKIQDSADNSAWADVTGASFTAATGATSQRLSAATAATALRQYVRYVATVAGGSTPTITFLLAYSRN